MALETAATQYGGQAPVMRTGARGPNDLSTFTQEFKRLQNQKWRMHGGVEARILTNLGFYHAEHYLKQVDNTIRSRISQDDEDKNRLYLVFSLIRKIIRRRIGHFWRISPEATATPDKIDPKAWDQAEIVDKLLLALDKKCKERQIAWLRYFWLTIGGVVVEHTPWMMEAHEEPIPFFDEQSGELLWIDNMTRQEMPQSQVLQMMQMGHAPERFTVKEELQVVGDVIPEIVDPLRFFIDAGVRSIHSRGGVPGLAPDQACYIADIKTVGWVAENFGEEYEKILTSRPSNLDIVKTRLLDRGPTAGNLALRDMIPAIQGTRDPGDPLMCMVLTRYQPPHKAFPRGRRTIFVPDVTTLDDDELPYEEIPCVDIHWEPNATSFWTPDFVTDLIPAQKFLNKRLSQLGEKSNSEVYEILLLGGQLSKEDIPSDLPGVVEGGLTDEGIPLVQSVIRQPLPGWFMDTIKFIVEYMWDVGGGDLLKHQQFPGQLRGSLAVPLIQEILDSEDGPFFDHLGESLSHIKQQRVNRVKKFYEPIRTLHYTDADQKDEVLVFHTAEVLAAGTEFNISIDRRSLIPELAALREARVRERVQAMPGLYLNRRTNQLDWSLVAQDLKYTDKGAESRASQNRKMARQIIAKLWAGEPVDPNIVLPFWDHNVMMDEYEAAMTTMEWNQASPQVKQGFIALHEKHREYLSAIQEAQANAVSSQMQQQAVAQATQQAAAKAAATAADAAIEQIMAQADLAKRQPMGDRVREAMGEGQQNQRQRAFGKPSDRPSRQLPAKTQ